MAVVTIKTVITLEYSLVVRMLLVRKQFSQSGLVGANGNILAKNMHSPPHA